MPTPPQGPKPGQRAASGAVPRPAVPPGPSGSVGYAFRPPQPPPPPLWQTLTAPASPAIPRLRVVAAGLLSGLLAAALLPDGLGVNLLIWAAAGTLTAGLAAVATDRRIRPWTVVWALAALVLLLVPALTEATWAVLPALLVAAGAGSLALHGGRRWSGVLLGSVGLWSHLVPGLAWSLVAVRTRRHPGRDRLVPVLKAVAVSAVLLLVFGALFASADPAVAELLDGLTPSIDTADLPMQLLLFVVGLLVAVGAAHAAAAPRRFDRYPVEPGRERGRVEWAVPLVALNLLFGVFAAVQAVVFVGGYEAVMRKPGVIPAEYARQGFWQLLVVTLLVLVVIALAKRWAPRSTPGDRGLVRVLLGLLGALTLVVVASALYRMHRYVDVFGLTRLRISVAAMEIWLGAVVTMVVVAVVLASARWLPRAVVLSAVVTAAVFGLANPDALIAEQNVHRFEQSRRIDIAYLRTLSADAVPALDRLPADQRACALGRIADDLASQHLPWYATSLAEADARRILRARPVPQDWYVACGRVGAYPDGSAEDDGYREYDGR